MGPLPSRSDIDDLFLDFYFGHFNAAGKHVIDGCRSGQEGRCRLAGKWTGSRRYKSDTRALDVRGSQSNRSVHRGDLDDRIHKLHLQCFPHVGDLVDRRNEVTRADVTTDRSRGRILAQVLYQLEPTRCSPLLCRELRGHAGYFHCEHFTQS